MAGCDGLGLQGCRLDMVRVGEFSFIVIVRNLPLAVFSVGTDLRGRARRLVGDGLFSGRTAHCHQGR